MSREAIIRQIVDRDLASKDLSEESIRKTESALYEIACDEFGSWETALEYAGVDARSLANGQEVDDEPGCNNIYVVSVQLATT